MKECWRDIPGYNGEYKISNFGRVLSLKGSRERIRPSFKNSRGYYVISLSKNGVHKTFKVHRLVAEAFLQNPKKLPQVNHIDGDKRNNNINNLEWATSKENIRHSIEVLGNIPACMREPKKVRCIETGVVYESLKSAADSLGGSSSNLCNLLKKRSRSEKFAGFHWEYL